MITALGLGTKQAPDNVNLDPQRQFWSWLSAFKNPDELGDSGHHERAYFSGFACTQTSPAGMSIQIGGGDDVDSAAIFIDSDRAVLLSTDGTPQKVTIPTAPASGSRIDAVVSYIDNSSPSAEDETPGTPEYVHTIVVSGTASSSPSAPTDAQIVSALPAGANAKYYRWCDVRVAQGATTITNSNITDKKPASPNVYWTTSQIEQIADQQIGDLGSIVHTTASGPFGMQMSLVRAGNVVTLYVFGSINGNFPAGSINFDEAVPSGYRPAYATGWVTIDVLNFSPSAAGRVSVGTNGKMTGYMYSQVNSGSHVALSAVYATNDQWPS